MDPYPLKLEPVFKSRIWGGRRLEEVFGKRLPPGEKIGESWEVADLPNGRCTISNGELAGRTLGEVVAEYPEQITGDPHFHGPFPLLIKFLDAQDILSVQVHPDAETCRRIGKGDPKTECWYIISAEPGAFIYKGVEPGVTRQQFAAAVENGTTEGLLVKVPVRAGECHFLPAGTAHSIGPGLLIAEIQTPSDTTYRVFDWNRADDSGKPRPLHIAEALESIHFNVTAEPLPVTTAGRLVDCPYFKIYKFNYKTFQKRVPVGGQMQILIFLKGSGNIEGKNRSSADSKAGDCVLIPAAFEGSLQVAADTEYLVVTL